MSGPRSLLAIRTDDAIVTRSQHVPTDRLYASWLAGASLASLAAWFHVGVGDVIAAVHYELGRRDARRPQAWLNAMELLPATPGDTCRWVPVRDHWLTACGVHSDNDPQDLIAAARSHCPYCGRKILAAV